MIRIGIEGTGRIAKRAVKEMAEVDELQLVTAFNPNKEHAEKFAKENGIEKSTADWEKFISCIDALYVASPHATHFEYTKKALENGKHVICEKPITLSAEETTELFDIAADKKLILMEAVKTAYCPGFKKLCEVVNNGTIGDVVDVEAAFTRLTVGETREFTDKVYGGAFTEFGTYTMLPIFRFLGTEFEKVTFEIVTATKDDNSVDGYTKVYFDYGNRFATSKCGLTVKSEGQLLISGTKGYILVPSPWWLTKYFEVRYEDPIKIEKYEAEFAGDGLRYEFEEFANRINKKSNSNSEKVEQSEAIARSRVFKSFLSERK